MALFPDMFRSRKNYRRGWATSVTAFAIGNNREIAENLHCNLVNYVSFIVATRMKSLGAGWAKAK